MLPLPEVQARFGRALRGESTALPIHARGLGGDQRLQVYRHDYQEALLNALRAAYPVTERLVGGDFFAAAAQAYIGRNPSRSGNLQDYGGVFPLFLQEYRPAASLPYLADVAALEWRRLQTAIAPGHKPMDMAALAAVPKDMLCELRFHHQPAARAFESRYPILSIWEFCQDPEPEGELNLDLGGECVLFSRPSLDVVMRRVSVGEYAFLRALCRGQSFAAACEAALAGDPAFNVQERFAALVQEEILTHFYF